MERCRFVYPRYSFDALLLFETNGGTCETLLCCDDECLKSQDLTEKFDREVVLSDIILYSLSINL